MKLRQASITPSSSFYWLIGAHCKMRKTAGTSGFTLIELLVALIIGSIITILMLGFTVQLMTNNQREGSRSDTQREMQAAIDYINRDVREAVYVYDGECLRQTGDKFSGPTKTADNTCPGILKYLPTELNSGTNLPVLAFWRLDPLPAALLTSCSANASLIVSGGASDAIKSIPCSARKMYTLVVYSLNNDNPNESWRGRTRIKRYTLQQYTEGSGTTETPGWYSPLATSFADWPRNPKAQGTGLPPATNLVTWVPASNQTLVDFVDDQPRDSGATTAAAACPSVNSILPEQKGGFYASPAQATGLYNATGISRRTFYTCVRGGDTASLNQEVIVRIQGNAAGQPGVPRDGNLPVTMETRILTRGVLGKS
jgi:prepilin-type N-terminal cleavage/methylation domain-containing protein